MQKFRSWMVALALFIVACAGPAWAVSITYGPLAAPEDPADGSAPTSVWIVWWTDQPTTANYARVGMSATGPWSFIGVDTNSSTRHEALITGLLPDFGYWMYVDSDGVASSAFQFSTGRNLLGNGSFETWHSVSQPWGTQEPDSWHGWEIYPWDPYGRHNENHLAISMDRDTGIPTPATKHLAHRAGMDAGWRSCYGGLYQQVDNLSSGTYTVSGWVAWKFEFTSRPAQDHQVEIIAKNGAHVPGAAPTGATIWQANCPTEDLNWKYVQGSVTCTTGKITVYVDLRSDYWDGCSYFHADNIRLAAPTSSQVGFYNFQSSCAPSGGTYNVTVSYDTMTPCTTQLQWGTDTSYGRLTATDPALVTHHVVQLTGVQPYATPYHYRAHATAAGIDEYSSDHTFDAPKVTFSNIAASVDYGSGTSCVVRWNTNYATSSNKLYYRKTGDPAYSVVQAEEDPTAGTSHTASVSGLALNTQYQYHVTSGGSSLITQTSTPDNTFLTPPQGGLPAMLGFAMVGQSILEGGDDVGPGRDWEHLMKYEHPYCSIDGLGFCSWAQCQPTDPGEGPDVYDWSCVDEFIAKATPGKSRTGYYQMWGTSPTWAHCSADWFWPKFEKFVEEQTVYINQHYGEVDIVFENEPNDMRNPPDCPPCGTWADCYIGYLTHFYTGVHRANARTGFANKVIGGNLAGHQAGNYAVLYSKGFKNVSDVVGAHPYPTNIIDGVCVADLATIHATMEQYGDSGKKIYVSEGWGSGRSAGFDRSDPTLEPPAQEVENMFTCMTKGFDNLMTPIPHWDPSYLWAIYFFPANDNWGSMNWRSRAIPCKDGSGNITGFIVDGYSMTPDIAPYFWNGGLYDFYGNSKDALHLVYPGNGLVFMNSGFELRSEPPRDNAPHFWTAAQEPPAPSIYSLDDLVYRGGSRSLKLTQTTSGANGVYEVTTKRSAAPGVSHRARVWCKTDDVSGVTGRFYMRFCSLDLSQKSQQYWATNVTGTRDWTQMEIVATAPSFTSRIEVGCYMAGVGTVHFDDVTISTTATEELGTVHGYTLDAQQVPVPYSVVGTTTGGYQAVSDEHGYYEIANVPSGTYDFVCRKAGYIPFRAKNQTVTAGRTSFVLFCMGSPKPGLTITSVQADKSTWHAGENPVNVTVTVANSSQYPVNVSDVGLFVENGGAGEVTNKFTIHASPSNPRTINSSSTAQFAFDLTPREGTLGLDVSINAYALAQEDTPNMLTNGNLDSTPWNQHWSFTGSQTQNWTCDTSLPHSAPNCLKRTFNTNQDSFDWAHNWSAWGASPPIAAKPYTNYILGCYHKEQVSTPPSIKLFIEEYYYNGSNCLYNGRRFMGQPRRTVWAHDCIIYNTGGPDYNPGIYPTNRLLASVGVHTPPSQTSSGTVWWDDIYLKEMGQVLSDDRASSAASLMIPETCSTLAEALAKPEGQSVEVAGQIVTAGSESFSSRTYVQSLNRAKGALVQIGVGPVPTKGTCVTVAGKVGDIDGEKALLNARATVSGPPSTAKPLALTGRSLESQRAMSGSLLVTICGKVTYIGPSNAYFLVDDGSGIEVVEGYEGVKVGCTGTIGGITPPAVGQFVSVTGISSCESGGAVSVIRPRSQGDVRPF